MKTIFPNLNPETIKWFLEFGIPRKKITALQLRASGFNELPSPVFFLSTGRCGTKWFSELLKKGDKIKVLHNPYPNLFIQGKRVYEEYCRDNENSRSDLIKEIYFAGREEYLRYAYKTEKRLIETNNGITFFAPILAELFPTALFVHLYRHPGEFIRSGIRRDYFTDSVEDIRRISPPEGSPEYSKWKSSDQIEKTSWLWNETNRFIESFKANHGQHRTFDLNFNELKEESVHQLIDFLGISGICERKVSNMLSKKINVQKSGSFNKYESWKDKDKEKVRRICGELAERYGYEL